MKKSLTILGVILLVICFTSCSLHAQQFNKQGTMEVGGTISYSSSTMVSNGETAEKSTAIFTFNPIASYFITDGFSLGVSPGYNYVKIAGTDNGISQLMLFLVPGYTFGKSNVYPFVEGWIGYTALNSDGVSLSGQSSGKLELSGLSFGGRGGVKIQVGKSGLFNLSVSYMALTFNPKDADKRTGLNNLALAMGFTIFIGK
jgi:hypothetical protein